MRPKTLEAPVGRDRLSIGLTMEEWLEDNLDEITQAMELTKDGLSDNPGELDKQMSRAVSEYSRMGYLLSDADMFLVQAKAKALSGLDQDLTAGDKKIVLDNAVKDIARLRDNLQVAVSALKNMTYAIMNTRRTNRGEVTP